jgi:transcriptional regulator with XRE-family HTH domain
MTEKTLDTQNSERAERLDQLLKDLAGNGFSQRQIAAELNVPPNYLSDLRHGQRTITDQFCRSFAHQFQIGNQWLATGEGAISSPQIGPLIAKAAGNLLLPVLSEPHVGDPTQCERWDGCQAEVTGAAAAAAGRAINPYIIRLSGPDCQGRLMACDLILISQQATETGDMAIARHRNRLMIVRKERKGDNDGWLALSSGKRLAGKPEIVGQCLGIVWAGL